MIALGMERVGDEVAFVLLDAGGRAPQISGTRRIPLEPGVAQTEQLQQALEQLGPARPDTIATALEEGLVTHRILSLPFSDPSRLAATIPFEIESLVPFDLEDAVVTFTTLHRGEGAEVLAALVPRDTLAADLDTLQSAGIDPAVVDVGAMALSGLFEESSGDLLVVEPRKGGAIALLREGRLCGLRVLGNATADERLREVRWLAASLLGDSPTPALVVVADDRAATEVGQALDLRPVPLEEVLPAWAGDIPVEFLRAAALAARASGVVSTGVNFRTGEFVYHAPSEEFRRQSRSTLAVAAVTAAIGLASYAVVLGERNSELERLQTEIRSTVSGIVENAPPGQERIRLQGAVEGLERRLAVLGGSGASRPAILDILKLIDESVPTTTALEVEDFSVDGQSIRFRARTDSYESVDVIKRALSRLPGTAEPDVRDVKQGIDDRIEFRTSIDFDSGGPR